MSEELNIAYHEVDFLLPVHRFDIRFSYVTKKGLPFTREFVLRLIHISPMLPSDLRSPNHVIRGPVAVFGGMPLRP